MAERTRVPSGYLSKVLQMLVSAGVVTSVRGVSGGYRLRRSAAETTILDIVNATEPLARIRRCPLGLCGDDWALCPLHQHLDDAIAHVESQLRGRTLADLVPYRAGEDARTPAMPPVDLRRCLGVGGRSNGPESMGQKGNFFLAEQSE